MSTTVSLAFRQDKINTKNEVPIYVRFTKNRRTSYVTTGIRIEEKYWDKKNSKIKASHPNSARLNNFLAKKLFDYQDKILKEETVSSKISVRQLKEKINGIERNNFFELAENMANEYKARNSISTYDGAKSVIKKILTFAKTDNIAFEDITTTFLAAYEKYLRNQLNNKTNTIHKDLRFIRTVFNRAIRLGLIEYGQSPFLKYQLKTERTQRTYLTEEELNKLSSEEYPLNSRLVISRDMFIFSAYCGGIRISDLLLMKWKNFDGIHLAFTIKKTKKQLTIKVPSPCLLILNRYKTNNTLPNSRIFPELPPDMDEDNPVEVDVEMSKANARINKNLKVIAKRAGIEKNVSFHCSRHSFGCLALRKGISIDKVSKLMAHGAIRETQIYARLVSEELDKAMDLFN